MRTDCGLKTSFFVLFIMLMCLLFAACGGGGGDDGGDTPSTAPSLTYTGSTSKAVIDEDNAVEITSDAVNGGIRGTVFDSLATLTDATDTTGTSPTNAFSTAIILQHAIFQLNDVSSSSPALDRAVTTSVETVDGPCGGSATGNFEIDDASGSFSGTLSFVRYCDSEVMIDGTATFSGAIDLATDEYASLNIHFDYLEGSDASGSYVFDGSIQMTIQSSGMMMTLNMYLQNGSDEDVFWLDNYLIEAVYYDSYMEMTLSGNFYSPNHGYITLSTQQALIIDDYTMTPHAGILIVSGENGSAGNPTTARLTCYPSVQFQVEADTDGDGLHDWQSDFLSWEDY